MATKQTKKLDAPPRQVALPTKTDLGHRGAGPARLVHDGVLDKDLVIVTIDGAAVANSKSRRYVKRHIEAVRGLSHPALVTVLDGGTDDSEGRGWLAEDHLEGERTLRQRLAEGPLPPRDALQVGLDLLNGLEHAHRRGLVHGGLTPDGVLVRPGPDGALRARLADYGFARIVAPERETALGPLRVDAEYAAPEMLKSEAADGRADLYSAALIIHEMLAGQHPIPAKGKDALLHRLHESAPPLPAGLIHDAAWDESVRSALRAALNKNPAARFATARAFAEALRPGATPNTGGHPEVAKEGGTCAGTGAAIPPLAQRPAWSRHETDGPFVCPVCKALHAGKASWDARGLCCKKCVEKPLDLAPAPSAGDVVLDLAAVGRAKPAAPPAEAPRPAAAKPSEEERRDALRSLIEAERQAPRGATPSGGIPLPPRPAAPAAPAAAPTPPGSATPPGGVPSNREAVGEAVLGAWSSEREKMREAHAKATSRHAKAGEPAAEAVVPAAPTPGKAPAAADGSGWRVAAGVLILLLSFVLLAWRDDKTRWELEKKAAVDAKLAELKKTNAAVESSGDELAKLRAERTGLRASLAEVRSAEAALRGEKAELDARVAQATSRGAALEKDKEALTARLADAAKQQEALAGQKAAVDAKLTETQGSLDRLGEERRALVTKLGLEPGTADRAAVEQRLATIEAERAKLEQQRAGLAQDVDAKAKALAAAEERRTAAERDLRRANSRLEDLELERRDLELQLVTASRGAAAMTEEKRQLEADLAAAQQELRAQEEMLGALLTEEGIAPAASGAKVDLPLARADDAGYLTPAEGERAAASARLEVPAEQLRALLVDAVEDRLLVAIHVRFDPTPTWPVVARVAVEQAMLDLPVTFVGDEARCWVEPAAADKLLQGLGAPGAPLTLTLSAHPDARGNPARVQEAQVVGSPLPPDVALRLRALRAQGGR